MSDHICIWSFFSEVNMAPKVDISDFANKLSKLTGAIESAGSIFDNTFKDIVARATGKIANAVTSEYSIKKSDIKHKKKYKIKKAGYISLHGQTLASLEFRYAGRKLTLSHFPFTPKSRPAGKKYKIKTKIKKQQKVINAQKDGGVFLAPINKSATVLPWMRYSQDRYDIAPVRTLSVPQMVDNKTVRKEINKELSELVDKRFKHHIKRHFSKKLK